MGLLREIGCHGNRGCMGMGPLDSAPQKTPRRILFGVSISIRCGDMADGKNDTRTDDDDDDDDRRHRSSLYGPTASIAAGP